MVYAATGEGGSGSGRVDAVLRRRQGDAEDNPRADEVDPVVWW